jgi:hypothetical protein
MNVTPTSASRWTEAWPDGLAFVIGLGLAWALRWSTTDLVWSLWLSSLVVGYALILWQVSGPLRELVGGLVRDRNLPGYGWLPKIGAFGLVLAGTLVGLAFFTLHFGGFHYVHSVFLTLLFPLDGGAMKGFPGWPAYHEVLVRYGWFLPAAFLAERGAFRRTYRDPDVSVTAAAIARRKAKGDSMMLPYRNVIRMHFLIFFFMAAHFAKVENFIVYAVVYAVYFFPWRLLKKAPDPAVATASP